MKTDIELFEIILEAKAEMATMLMLEIAMVIFVLLMLFGICKNYDVNAIILLFIYAYPSYTTGTCIGEWIKKKYR